MPHPAHIQHVLSLELSLHTILLPEVVRQDRPYFNMITADTQGTHPLSASPDDLVFERKKFDQFLHPKAVLRENTKVVKQHLKICNAVLMYIVTRWKQKANVLSAIRSVQAIFDQFEEHEFPA
jgi:hypothetical protein